MRRLPFLLRFALVPLVALSACRKPAEKKPDPDAIGDLPLVAPVTPKEIPLASAVVPRPGRSTGCDRGGPPAVGETRRRGERSFHAWTPKDYDATRPYALVLAFHGWSSNGRGFQQWFKMEEHVRGEAIVVYPDSAAARWDFAGETDLALFDDILADASERFCIDASRVFAIGFSYGGRIVSHIGCRRSSVLRGISTGGSDWQIEERSRCGRVPVLVNHRTHDSSMPFAGGRASAAKWAGVNGCGGGDVVTEPRLGCRSYTSCSAPVVFCADTHFDPTWPASWNHTVREDYLDYTWSWLAALP